MDLSSPYMPKSFLCAALLSTFCWYSVFILSVASRNTNFTLLCLSGTNPAEVIVAIEKHGFISAKVP